MTAASVSESCLEIKSISTEAQCCNICCLEVTSVASSTRNGDSLTRQESVMAKFKDIRRLIAPLLLIVAAAGSPGLGLAQEPKEGIYAAASGNVSAADSLRPLSLNLSQTIDLARSNFPEIKTAAYRAEASRARVRREKTAYLPRGSMLVQELRGTSNQITGPLLPNATIPQITGAEVGGNDLTGGWGSATGTLVSWEPFDFGLRRANVRTAQAEERLAKMQASLTELEAMVNAAESFLKAAATQQAVRAAKAKLDRMTTLKETVKVLFDKRLRSNTDALLAEAEEARAKDQWIDAEQAYELALADLAESVGVHSSVISIAPQALLNVLPGTKQLTGSIESHPAWLLQSSAIDVAAQRKRAIEKTYYPKFNIISAIYGRGSSFNSDISISEGKGYYPRKINYVAGLSIYFPFLDIFELRAQHLQASKLELAERARLELTTLKLTSNDKRANAMMKGALRIDENAPIKVRAAREAAASARARYQLQLASINDIAQDEQLLAQAEVEEATARLRVWRALLAEAAAKGSIAPFAVEVGKAESK